MVKYTPKALETTFAALADSTRQQILLKLVRGETSVSRLAEPFGVSLPAVMKHLRVLQSAGLVVSEKRGRVRRYRLVAAPLKDAANWLNHYRLFWDQQFDSLARYLGESADQQGENPLWNFPQSIQKTRSGSEEHSRRHGRKSSKRGPIRRH